MSNDFRLTVTCEGVALHHKEKELKEDDVASWARFTIHTRGVPNPSLWYTDASEARKAKTQIADGANARYSYERKSKAIELSDDRVNDILHSTLEGFVYIGENGQEDADTLIGKVSIPLESLITGDGVRGNFKLRAVEPAAAQDKDAKGAKGKGAPAEATEAVDPSAYEGSTLKLRVTGTQSLAEFVRGSRILTIPKAYLSSIPAKWLPLNEGEKVGEGGISHEEAAKRCGDPALNPAQYVMSLLFPEPPSTTQAKSEGGDAADGEEEKGEGTEASNPSGSQDFPLHLGTGKLQYVCLNPGRVPEEGKEQTEEGKEGKKEDAEAGEGEAENVEVDEAEIPVEPKWEWRIVFASRRRFVSSARLEALTEMIENGRPLTCRVQRVLAEELEDTEGLPAVLIPDYLYHAGGEGRLQGAAWGEEDFEGRGHFEVKLDALLKQGQRSAAVENEIIPDPVTEEEKEKEAEAATKRAETVGTILSKKEGGGGKGKPAKGKPAAKGKGKAPPPKKGGKGKNEPEEEPDTRHEYEKAGTSAGFTLEFNEPLVLAVPEPPAPETKPSDLVPPRDRLPLGPRGLPPTAEFRRDVILAVHALAEEYVNAATDEVREEGEQSAEDRRKRLLAVLNTGGLYQAMKEKLKSSVVRIVRERFKRKEAPANETQEEKDRFVSGLYTYLIGQTHRAINAAFRKAGVELVPASTEATADSDDVVAVATDPDLNAAQWLQAGDEAGSISTLFLSGTLSNAAKESPSKGGLLHAVDPRTQENKSARYLRIAKEQEYRENYLRANQCHQDRIALHEKAVALGEAEPSADVWSDYADFLLRVGKVGKARECYKEALSIQDNHSSALIGYAILSLQRKDPRTAAVMAKAAAELGGEQSALSEALASLASEQCEEKSTAAAALERAMKALQATNAAPDGAGMGPAYLETATAALGLGALDVAQAALTKATDAMVDLPVPRAVLARQLTLQALYELSMVTGKGSVGASGEGPRPASLEIDHILLLTSQALDLDKGPNASLTWQIKGQAEQRSHLLEAAKDSLQMAIGSWDKEVSPGEAAVAMRLADVMAQLVVSDRAGSDRGGAAKQAAEVYLRAAKANGWSIAWAGAGGVLMKTGGPPDAEVETALNEANVRDSMNAEVWALLTLMAMRWQPAGSMETAQTLSLEQALKNGLGLTPGAKEREFPLLLEIAEGYLDQGKAELAEVVARRSLAVPDLEEFQEARARLYLAKALQAQRKDEEAEEESKKVLGATSNPSLTEAAQRIINEAQQRAGRATM